jgi:hypothetical protein
MFQVVDLERNMMNDRQRILSILKGSSPDRIPWIPRLEIWHEAHKRSNTLPPQWTDKSLREIERSLGLGTPAREGKIFDLIRENVEIVSKQDGNQTIVSYKTPVGELQQINLQTEERYQQGLPGVVVEHLLKGPDDYRVWEWIVQYTSYAPTYDEYLRYDEKIGEDGLPLVIVSHSPFYTFLEVLVGYEKAFFHLADYPEEVDHLLSVMAEVQRAKEWPLIVQSPAQLILTDAHISSQFTPPKIFMQHIYPYHRELNDLLHSHGKWSAMHADADTSRILNLVEHAGWDMVECFVTAPMVPLTLEQARRAWGNRVIIWGGIPSLILSPSIDEEQFRAYCNHLFDIISPGDAFILGVADNVMPDSLIERIAWITDRVIERGWYPVA